MEAAKITPKPLTHADRINKARDISGLRKRMGESRFVGGLLTILGWFTIPAEVFLRRRLGYRWFTPTNFLIGLVLMYGLFYLQYALEVLRYHIASFESAWNPFYSSSAQRHFGATLLLNSCSVYYLIFGLCKLFMRWWRARTNVELHSFDDGISWLEFLGVAAMEMINAVAKPFLYVFFYLSRAKKRGVALPELINDKTVFTNTVIEPAVILVLGHYCPYTIPKLWLAVTGIAVAIHANMKEAAKRTRVLDFQDSRLEAQAMKALMNGNQEAKKKPVVTKEKVTNKQPTPKGTPKAYPDLQTIIEEHWQENRFSESLASLMERLRSAK